MVALLGIIEISNTDIELIIYEKTENKDMFNVLEYISEEINLSPEDESNNSISMDEIDKLCKIILKMKNVLKDYDVTNTIVTAKNFFNKIKNLNIILDYIFIKTNFKISIPTPFERKRLILKKFIQFEKSMLTSASNTLLLSLEKESIDFYLFSKNKLLLDESLETSDIFQIVENEKLSNDEMFDFIEDQLKTYLLSLKTQIGRKKILNLSIIGDEDKYLTTILESKGIKNLQTDDLKNILNNLKKKSFKDITKKYNITNQEAIHIFTKFSILEIIRDFFDIKILKYLSYDSKNIIAYENFYKDEKKVLREKMWKMTLDLLDDFGNKYNFNKNHVAFVLESSETIFDSLSDLHQLGTEYKKYLILASYLQDVGKYIGFSNHNRHSNYIIENSFIFGLTEKQLRKIIFLVSISKTNSILENSDKFEIPENEIIPFVKLGAILKLARSLDESKKQKFKNFKATLKNNSLVLEAESTENFLLEKFSINKNLDLFKNVFNLDIELKIKRRYHGE